MKIGIFGSTGFIGRNLKALLSQNHTVFSFSRKELDLEPGALALKLEGLDVIINLSGAPVLGKRWTNNYKREILNSRIDSIHKIKDALGKVTNKPGIFISASAIGIYVPGVYSDESTVNFGHDFLAEVVEKWEKAAFEVTTSVPSVFVLRFGIVLGKDGGALKEMINIYKKRVAVILGPGAANYPFISINDLIKAVYFLIESRAATGVYNFVAPVKTTNLEFSGALSKILKTHLTIKVPSWLFKTVLGKRAEVIMAGQVVYPKKLLSLGFDFQDSDIAEFLGKEIKPG